MQQSIAEGNLIFLISKKVILQEKTAKMNRQTNMQKFYMNVLKQMIIFKRKEKPQ